jgi:hypothetical protein
MWTGERPPLLAAEGMTLEMGQVGVRIESNAPATPAERIALAD